MKPNNPEKIESYIARVSTAGNINIRKAFRKDGLVKVQTLTKKEIDEYTKIQEESIKEEIEILQKQKSLREHLNKLRELRNGRKRVL